MFWARESRTEQVSTTLSSMSQETRKKILEAATRAFSEADSQGTSLRAIARAAGVNSALIQYHFGSREGLFEAAFVEALRPVQTRRDALLAKLEDSSRPSPDELARLFVEPFLPTPDDSRERQLIALRLIARTFTSERGLALDITLLHFQHRMDRIHALLARALPELPPELRSQRARLCLQTALETLAGAEMELAVYSTPDAPATLVADLIAFLAGGLAAPPAPPTPTV